MNNYFLKFSSDPSIRRYVGWSIFGYIAAFLMLKSLSFFTLIDQRIGYAIVYLLIYVLRYPVTVFSVYRVKHSPSNLLRYGVYLFLNWSVASALYFVLTHAGLGIFQAFVLVALIMFPLRFVFGKRVYQ